MPDVRVKLIPIPSPISVTYDWLQRPDGMLDETQELATAVTIALGSDARAAIGDSLPDIDSDDRRGWWGDLDCETLWDAWPLGSRLWLMARAAITDVEYRDGAALQRIESYIHEAIQPFILARIASQFAVKVERTEISTIVARIIIYRGPLPAIELRYQALWESI